MDKKIQNNKDNLYYSNIKWKQKLYSILKFNGLKLKYFLFLLYGFILFLLVFPCIIAAKTNVTLLYDGANFILNALSSFSENKFYVENNFLLRARMTVIFLDFLPLNIAYFVFKISNFKILTAIYSATLIFLPVLLCLYSILLFFRVQKKYLSVFPLILLGIGILPVTPYGCVECYRAVFIFFVLFLYFLLPVKFTKLDYIIFIILNILIYNAHEACLLFIPFIWYTFLKISDKNNKILLFGFINSIFVFILYVIFLLTPFGPDILADNALISTIYCFFPPFYIIDKSLINFHLFLYALVLINILSVLYFKSKTIPVITAFISLLSLLLAFPEIFEFNFLNMYRFVNIYMLLFITLILILLNNKQDLLTKISYKLIPLTLFGLIAGNVFITEYSKEFHQFMNELVSVSNKQIFYLVQDKTNLSNYKIYKGHLDNQWNIEQIAYSIIAINSIQNRNKTKSIIIGYDQKTDIHYCGDIIRAEGGALNIKTETPFWTLTDFKYLFRNACPH